MEWYNSNAVLVFYCQCERNHLISFHFKKLSQKSSLELSTIDWPGKAQAREFQLFQNWDKELVIDLLHVFRKTSHLDLQIPVDLLWLLVIRSNLNPHKNGNLLHRYNHTITLPYNYLNIFHSYAQLHALGRILPSSMFCHSLYRDEDWDSANDPTGLSWDVSVKWPALHR